MTWQALMKEGLHTLIQAGLADVEQDVHLLAMHVMHGNYQTLILHMQDEVSEEEKATFMQYISMRMTHMPCQYIIGVQNFMGYDFEVAQDVLIPRLETELLVEQALEYAKTWPKQPERKRRVLDLCCGSGCIGISFAKLANQSEEVVLADISDAAIALSKKNNRKLDAGCKIIQSDLFEHIEGMFDMIVSNPPYICTDEIPELMEEVRDFEPHLALDGKTDGLYFYKKIIKEARKNLNEEGYLLFEIGQDQLEAVRGLLVDNGYEHIVGKKDYAGLDRIVAAQYPAGKDRI